MLIQDLYNSSNINLDEIKQIEEDIRLLNETFETLNQIIECQGTEIQTLEDSISESKKIVSQASQEIIKAKEYQWSYDKYIYGTIFGFSLGLISCYGLAIPITITKLSGSTLIGTYLGSKL